MKKGNLVDITQIQIDKSLSRKKRIEKFVEEIGDPYHFRAGQIEVKINFEPDGSLQSKMQHYFDMLNI